MKKLLTLAVSVVMGTVLAVVGTTASFATESIAACVPKDAWTEVVPHPAVGSPTITVPNPNYVPAKPAQTVQDGFIKWNWTGGPVHQTPSAPPGNGWHRVGPTNDSKGNTPGVVHKGKGKGSYFFYEINWKTIPEVPAVGLPTNEVSNPDYISAWDEIVEHEAVTCGPVGPQPETLTGETVVTGDPVCVTPLDGTAVVTTTTTPWSQTYFWSIEGSAWTLGERVNGVSTDSDRMVDSEACAKVIVPKPDALTGTETRNGTPVCVEPRNGTATMTTETRSWTQDYSMDESGEWALGSKDFTKWVVQSTETFADKACAAMVVPEVDEPKKPVVPNLTTVVPTSAPTPPVLVSTGAEQALWPYVVFPLLVGSGVLVLLMAGARKRSK